MTQYEKKKRTSSFDAREWQKEPGGQKKKRKMWSGESIRLRGTRKNCLAESMRNCSSLLSRAASLMCCDCLWERYLSHKSVQLRGEEHDNITALVSTLVSPRCSCGIECRRVDEEAKKSKEEKRRLFLSFFFLKEEEAKSHCASRESTVVLFSCVWILLFFPSFSTSMRFLWYLFRFTSLRRAQRSKKEKRKKSGVVVVVAGSYLMGRPTGRASCLIEFSLLRLLRRLRSSAAPLSPLLFLYTIYYPWRGFSGADEEEIKRRGEKEGRKEEEEDGG